MGAGEEGGAVVDNLVVVQGRLGLVAFNNLTFDIITVPWIRIRGLHKKLGICV